MASCPSPKPFIPAPGGIKFTWGLTQSFVPMSYGLSFYSPVDPVPEYMEELAQEGAAQYDAWQGLNRPATLGPAVCSVTDLASGLFETYTHIATRLGDPLRVPAPSNICMLYILRTATAGRNSHGALWEPNVPYDQIDGRGKVLSGPGGAWWPIQSWFDRIAGAPWFLTPVIWSYCLHGAWRDVAVKYPVIGVRNHAYVHSRRARLFGHSG